DAEKALLVSSVEVFSKSLDLTQNRRAGGIASDLDVAQAETVLKMTQAQLPATMLQRAQFEHALAVLTGVPASSFTIAERPLDAAPPIIPPGLPSELLERRPDVAGAERRMAAANASIGVAEAAFFPTVTLSASAGTAAEQIGKLLSAASRTWAFGSTLAETIFDAGARHAIVEQNRALLDAAIADYRQTVLTGFQQVEDDLP